MKNTEHLARLLEPYRGSGDRWHVPAEIDLPGGAAVHLILTAPEQAISSALNVAIAKLSHAMATSSPAPALVGGACYGVGGIDDEVAGWLSDVGRAIGGALSSPIGQALVNKAAGFIPYVGPTLAKSGMAGALAGEGGKAITHASNSDRRKQKRQQDAGRRKRRQGRGRRRLAAHRKKVLAARAAVREKTRRKRAAQKQAERMRRMREGTGPRQLSRNFRHERLGDSRRLKPRAKRNGGVDDTRTQRPRMDDPRARERDGGRDDTRTRRRSRRDDPRARERDGGLDDSRTRRRSRRDDPRARKRDFDDSRTRRRSPMDEQRARVNDFRRLLEEEHGSEGGKHVLRLAKAILLLQRATSGDRKAMAMIDSTARRAQSGDRRALAATGYFGALLQTGAPLAAVLRDLGSRRAGYRPALPMP